MAKNNGFNGSHFFGLVEDEFLKIYDVNYSDSEPDFGLGGLNDHGIEHTDQNYPMEASGGGEDKNVDNICPPYNEDVLSSSAVRSSSFESKVSNSNYVGSNQHDITDRASDLLMSVSICTEANKSKIVQLASEAMDELTRMARAGEPVWRIDPDKNMEMLNKIEYLKGFGNMNTTIMEIMKMVEVGKFEPLPRYPYSNKERFFSDTEDFDEEFLHKDLGLYDRTPSHHDQLHSEGSRAIGCVRLKPIEVVELLMDSKQWSLVFSKIVSRAAVLGILRPTGTLEQQYEGYLKVMSAEFHAPTPHIPTRESYFVRYCKRLGHGMWAVVDVSLESLIHFPSAKTFRRRPSGCLITEMPDGFSKIIWVEHVEVDDTQVHNMFRPLVTSGFAFGAKRWVASLAQQCARIMTSSPPIIDGSVSVMPEAGRRSMLKLSERMIRSFCSEISASSANKWGPFPNSGANIRDKSLMMTKTYNDEPGKPRAPTVMFAISEQLPATPKEVFEFLSNGESRSEWDVLSEGLSIRELVRISTGDDPENHLSIIQLNATPDKIVILYLQQSYTDPTGSYVVFAPLEILAVQRVLSGGISDFVRILPSGFVILPDVSKMHGGIAHASLLTVGLHIVDDMTNTGELTLSAAAGFMHNIILAIVNSVQKAVITE